ncbi:MAG: hypothetical protein ACR2FQ_11335 [Pseudonocardiaceae bacterium]
MAPGEVVWISLMTNPASPGPCDDFFVINAENHTPPRPESGDTAACRYAEDRKRDPFLLADDDPLSRWLIPPLAEPVEDEDVVGGSAGPLSGPNTGKLTFDGVSEPYRVG